MLCKYSAQYQNIAQKVKINSRKHTEREKNNIITVIIKNWIKWNELQGVNSIVNPAKFWPGDKFQSSKKLNPQNIDHFVQMYLVFW